MFVPAFPVPVRLILGLRAHTIVMLAVFLLAIALRFHHLGITSLWTDELFTSFYARLGTDFLWGQGLRIEPTPPLYYSLIGIWERVAGDSACALRLPSVAGSLIGIGLAVLLARELFHRGASALFAAALLALAPVNIAYAQEARSYALQGAALALALLGFARVLRQPPGRLVAFGMYGTGATVAMYLHPTSLLAVMAINVAALISTLGRGCLLNRAGLVRWIITNAVVAAICLPLVVGLLSSGDAAGWIPELSRWSLELALGGMLFGGAVTDQPLALFEILVVAMATLILLPPWRPGRLALTVLVVVPVVFLLLMIGISIKKPLLLSRTLAWLLIPLAILLGDVLARRAKIVAVAVIFLVAYATVLQLRQVDHLKEDWQGLLAMLPGLEPPALVVLAPATPPSAFAVYAPQARPVRLNGGYKPTVETTIIPAMFGTRTIQPQEMQAAIKAGDKVWLVVRRPDYEWMIKAIADLPPPKMTVFDGDPRNPAVRALLW